ncbi:LysM domain-containing protein, partial [Micromonospora sp. DH15]|nr:LysM domain-containing protein [Micromonospora sp. DH15]
LGEVAERYLDDFDRYRDVAKLNRLGDPDRIRPGQLITLPDGVHDTGARRHATGKLVVQPTTPTPGGTVTPRPPSAPATPPAADAPAAPGAAPASPTPPSPTSPRATRPAPGPSAAQPPAGSSSAGSS